MKRYNLSEIMRTAHSLYNKTIGKYTWAEALKKSWKMAKFDVMVASQRKAMEEARKKDEARQTVERAKRAESFKNWEPAKPSVAYNDLSIPQSAFYSPNSKGRFGSHYVGD